MEPVIEALEQIETMLLQQQAQINQVAADVSSLAKLLQTLTEVVENDRSEGKQP